MKFTTKLISGIAALAIAAVCCGCGGNGNTASDADKDKTNGSLTAKAGTLTMATNATFPPYEYKEGEDRGYRRRGCKAYCGQAGNEA